MNRRHAMVLVLLVACAGAGTTTTEPVAKKTSAGVLACGDPIYRRLDFLVGDWAVYFGDRKIMESRVEAILGGCAVLEQWRITTSGAVGLTLHYVDPLQQRWKQVWVRDAPMLRELTELPGDGGGGVVRFEGVNQAIEQDEQFLLTMTPAEGGGEVRMRLESSLDEGATWLPAMELRYFRLVQATAPSAKARGACGGELHHRLDFWLGEWQVFEGDKLAGENRIERVLGGCAVVEHWRSTQGQAGFSLFYVDPSRGQWKQVWLVEGAKLKEKAETAHGDGPGIRFQGTAVGYAEQPYPDRTTLTPLGDGKARQLIEVSTDGGATWTPVFDATYVRR